MISYKLAFILFVMTMGPQTVGIIAVYGSVTQLVILMHGLACKSDTVQEFERGRCFLHYLTCADLKNIV